MSGNGCYVLYALPAEVPDASAQLEAASRHKSEFLAPADQEAGFEEFRQAGTADKKAGGTGLGLPLSRKFIELDGGKIWVKSQLGTGSTFTFTRPVRPRCLVLVDRFRPCRPRLHHSIGWQLLP